MKTKRIGILLPLALLGLGLSACGKNNYNGTYTGTEIRTAAQSGVDNSHVPNFHGGYNNTSYRQVTASLNHDGEIVTGTYSASMSTGQYSNYPMSSETYSFRASAVESDQLTNVQLYPTSGGSNCMYMGTLKSTNNGRQLSGTLTPASSASYCYSLQVTLDRPKN